MLYLLAVLVLQINHVCTTERSFAAVSDCSGNNTPLSEILPREEAAVSQIKL